MTLAEAVKQTRAAFVYERDKGGDNWRVTDDGDCEDFILSALRRYWGKPSRLKFYWRLIAKADAVLFFVRVRRGPAIEGHAVCFVDSHWFDIGVGPVSAYSDFSRYVGIDSGPVRYTRLQLIGKLLRGRL